MARYALMVAALAGFLATAAVIALLLPVLQRIRAAQPNRHIAGPTEHQKKAGTPTMGGIALTAGAMAGLGVAWLCLSFWDDRLLNMHQKMNLVLAVACTLAFAFIGFAEDCMKVVQHRSCGLRLWQRLVLEAVATGFLLLGLYYNGALETGLVMPLGGYAELGWRYFPLAFLLVLIFINSVHATDGIDGLCGSMAFVSMLGFLVVCGMRNAFQLSLLAGALAGALVAFLLWNFAPAKIFLGDTGSFLLGGAMISIAFCMGWPGLLIGLGGMYLLEGVSIAVQWTWFHLSGGKKLISVAPVHAAMERRGWSEGRITALFSVAASALMLLAVWFVYIS